MMEEARATSPLVDDDDHHDGTTVSSFQMACVEGHSSFREKLARGVIRKSS